MEKVPKNMSYLSPLLRKKNNIVKPQRVSLDLHFNWNVELHKLFDVPASQQKKKENNSKQNSEQWTTR